MKTRKILVLGATGKTGRKVAQRLQAAGHEVRLGSRQATPAFDWNAPSTWPAALAGMDGAYITFQPDLAVPGGLPAIRAFSEQAVRSGLKKLVLLSGRGEPEAQACEKVVMASGLSWTIVRADWFNQNFSESFFLEPLLAGHVALPQASTGIPFIDTDDIAEVAATAFSGAQHDGQVYELTGPRLLTLPEVVEEIATASGREIAFTPISLEAYKANLLEAGIPTDYIWLIDYLFSKVLDGRNSSTTNGVEKVLGRKPKDFSAYVAETVNTGVWSPA